MDPTRPVSTYLELRKLAIIAMFSDDVLMGRLALKGGNALDIVLGIGGRTSFDLDFSIDGDFPDFADVRRRVTRAIEDRFDSAGYKVFDLTFDRRPTVRRKGMPEEWGGYRIEFKVINKAAYERLGTDKERMFTEAEDVAPGFRKRLTIEISHHEYTSGKIEVDLDHHTVVVYTPAMIAVEKIRAICQQMPEYALRGEGTPRARDFYDICRICEAEGVGLDAEVWGELLQRMFEAKRVPLKLLHEVDRFREYHRQNWTEVANAVREPLESGGFDFYFDYTLKLIAKLELPRNE